MAKAKRSKSSAARQKSAPVKVEDFNWGSIFTGTRAALIRARLVPPEFKLKRIHALAKKSYFLPLDWGERYNEACYGPNFGPIPPRWDADVRPDGDGIYCVYVDFDPVSDLAVRQRAEMVIAKFDELRALLLKIPPRALSEAVREAIADTREERAHG